MKFLVVLALPTLLAATLTAQTPAQPEPTAPAPPQADTLTDAQVLTAAQTQASLACPDYTPERGNPGVAAIPVAALRILAKHEVVLCPDTRLKDDAAIVWYPKLGVFTWKPGDPAILKTLAEIVDRIARLDDFPGNLIVWDALDEELNIQNAPEFTFKDTYTRPE
jgi:hypothetical protein